MANFADALRTLEDLGIMDVLLPFILIFTIIFAVLQKTKILGQDNEGKPRKNFDVIIALVMALAVVIPHVMGTYPPNSDIVNIINSALPNISVIAVAIIMLLLIIGVFGANVEIAGTSFAGLVVIFAILAVVVVFGSAAGWFGQNWPSWLDFLRDSETQSLVIIILVFGIIIWFITKEDKKDKEKTFLDFFKEPIKHPYGKKD